MLKYLIPTTILFASPLAAGSLRVVADIAPVHSLTAQVMGDLGAPELLTAPGANPHSHALRPSEAARLQNADLLVWIGPLMSPWLGEAKAEMAPDAASLSLMEAEGTLLLDKRGAEDHDHTHEHEHEHERDDHKDHDSHDEETAAKDAHAWLSPDNALIWLTRIADRLASLDPDNAATYHSNAATAGAALKLQIAETEASLAPLAGREFLTAHDAYQYFQRRFGLTSHAAVSNADDQDAGPAHLRALLEDGADLACFVVEPSTAKASIALVVDTLNIPAVEIDALGAALPLGTGHYAALMAHLTEGFQTCLTP